MSRNAKAGNNRVSVRFQITPDVHPALCVELSRAGKHRRERVLALMYQGLTLEGNKVNGTATTGVEAPPGHPEKADGDTVGTGRLSELFGLKIG